MGINPSISQSTSDLTEQHSVTKPRGVGEMPSTLSEAMEKLII